MFVVIQEVKVKTVPRGEGKAIEVYETHYSAGGEAYCEYDYRYSDECFERPVRNSYRISIHESYRENGKVKKRQTAICTIGYYDVVDWGDWIGDYVRGGMEEKAEALGLEESELEEMVYRKWNPIAERILAEYQQTEEYAAREEHRRIISEHDRRVDAFVKLYGVERNEYRRCYDVFGKLRNPAYLEKIKAGYEARMEYERQSRKQSRRYYEEFTGNYRASGGAAACGYDETEKAILKKFYRTLSKIYHPDSNPDRDISGEMTVLNRIKGEWGI